MRILWCGPYFSDRALYEKRAPNQAAAKWSRGLLSALCAQGVQITVISHCPEQLWPRGRVFWQNSSPMWFLPDDECVRIGYPNWPIVRERYLDFMYAHAARRVLTSRKIDAVVCYNSLHSFHVAVMKVAHERGVPAIPIILDGDDPRKDAWAKILCDTRFATGVVFLSWWAAQNFPARNSCPVLHLDGGADGWNGGEALLKKEEGHIFHLVYTGALDQWRGLGLMRSIVKKCVRQDVRFVFCGKFDCERMWAEFDCDSRVDVRGFVVEDELRRICLNADLFLNVRDPKVGDNILNYPSKIPQYLSWGHPVVSTWIDSLSPEYRDVLQLPADDSVKAYVEKINEVLDWNPEQRTLYFNRVKSWFRERKEWNTQAKRFQDFALSFSSQPERM